MKNKIVILLLIALLLPSASAEFIAIGDTSVNLVPCGTTIGNLTIQHQGDAAADYTISVDGAGSDYITFSTIEFTLQAQQTAIINTFYNVPCTIAPDAYPISIFFTDGETEQQLDQEIIVAIPNNLNTAVQQTSAVIAPCDTAEYTLTLQNPLNFTEIYNLEASGHPNVHLSEKIVVLQGNEEKNIIVSATPEDCTQSGSFPLLVKIDTEKSRQQTEIPLEFIIKATDIPVLAEGTNRIRTDYQDSTAELTIENTGDRITQYSLKLEGADWASISPTTVSLNPGQTKTLALRLAPTEDVPKGTYALSFIATVEQTGIQYSKDLTIQLQPPTFIETNPILAIAILIGILALIAGIYFLIKLLRSQKFKTAYARWKKKIADKRAKLAEKRRKKAERKAALKQKKLEQLKKQQEKEKAAHERQKAEQERIKKKLEQQIRKDNHVVSKKDIVLGKKTPQTYRTASIIFILIVLGLIAATIQLVKPNAEYVLLGLIILAVIYLAKKLSRNRVIRARWKLFLAKKTITIHAWKRGLSTLSITAEKPIQNFKLLIRKTRAKIAASPTTYSTFKLKANAEASYNATFSVSKAWLQKHNIQPDEVRLAKYAKNTWTTVPLKQTGEDKTAVHYSAPIKEGTYSIFTKNAKQQKTNKLGWAFIGIALLIAAAIALSGQPSTLTQGIPPQTWQQDMVHSLDLGKYFKDPDGDALKYLITQTNHITVDIIGNTAYFTPETGWTGEERIKITATDEKEASTTSNTIPLRVQKQIIPVKAQPYIAIALAILTILILIWTALAHKNK